MSASPYVQSTPWWAHTCTPTQPFPSPLSTPLNGAPVLPKQGRNSAVTLQQSPGEHRLGA